MGEAHELEAGVELAPGHEGVVDAVDAQAQLEAQVLVVPQGGDDVEQVLADDEQGELVVLDDDLLDGSGRVDAGLTQVLDEGVDGAVEPAAVGAGGGGGQGDGGLGEAVAGGVAGVGGAELPGVARDDLDAQLGAHGGAGDLGHGRPRGDGGLELLGGGAVGGRGGVTHASWPFISDTGVAARAAASTARAISSRCLSMGLDSIWRVSSSMALMSISGRGGQPGR